MLNINEKLLDELDADQYYLISKLARYGKKSCPRNEVLCKATKWGIKRIQRVKKELIALGVLEVSTRWKKSEGKAVRDSNQYRITSKLISKYNKKAPNYAHVEQFTLEQFGAELVRFDLDQFELVQNGTDSNTLRIVIIDNKELLIEKDIESKKDTPTQEEILQDQFKKLQAENDRLNLKLKNQSEAQKGKEKSSAKKEKVKHVFPSNEPRKAYKANASGFPSMDEFDEMPVHEQQITTKYEAFLKDYKYPASWSEDLKESFLEWCAYKNEILLGSFGATNTKAVIREIKDYLKTYDIDTICKSIQLSLKEGWKSFDPQRVINREEKKKQDAAKQQANSKEGLYESWERIVDEGFSPNGNANGSNTVDTSWADA